MEFCFKVVLLGLLLFTTLNGAEEIITGRCGDSNEMEIGETLHVYNPEYPKFSWIDRYCKWEIRSVPPVTINCTIELSHDCNENSLTITFAEGNIFHFCGYNTFFNEGTNPIIIWDSTPLVRGRFECEIKSVNDSCNCGWKKVTSIAGDQETGVNEYPMMCGIFDVTKRIIYCGCTIIAERYVLTAAHCLDNKISNINTIRIVVGEHDTSTGKETNATRKLRLDKCMTHFLYAKDSGTFFFDVAVCKTKKNIEFSSEVGPVCLPLQHVPKFVANVTALGWGLLSDGGRKSNTLQKVDLNVMPFETCKMYNTFADNNTMCTFTPEKDVCQMVSGGPLLWQNPHTNNLVLVGIVSNDSICASKTHPALAMRVEAMRFITWIKDVTPDAQYCRIE